MKLPGNVRRAAGYFSGEVRPTTWQIRVRARKIRVRPVRPTTLLQHSESTQRAHAPAQSDRLAPFESQLRVRLPTCQ